MSDYDPYQSSTNTSATNGYAVADGTAYNVGSNAREVEVQTSTDTIIITNKDGTKTTGKASDYVSKSDVNIYNPSTEKSTTVKAGSLSNTENSKINQKSTNEDIAKPNEDINLATKASYVATNLFNGTLGYLSHLRLGVNTDESGNGTGISVTNKVRNEVTSFDSNGSQNIADWSVTTGEGTGRNYAQELIDSGDPIKYAVDNINDTLAGGIVKVQNGDMSGIGDVAVGGVATILLPTDLAATINKGARGEEITTEDVLYSAVDAVGLIPGIGWLAKLGLKGVTKGAKATIKASEIASDVTKTTDKVTDVVKTTDTVTDARKATSWVDDAKAPTSFSEVKLGTRVEEEVTSLTKATDVSKAEAKIAKAEKAESTINKASKVATAATIAGTTIPIAYTIYDFYRNSENSDSGETLVPSTTNAVNTSNPFSNTTYETRGDRISNTDITTPSTGGDNGTVSYDGEYAVTYDGEYSLTSGSGGGGSSTTSFESGSSVSGGKWLEEVVQQITEKVQNNLPTILIIGGIILAIIILSKNSRKVKA